MPADKTNEFLRKYSISPECADMEELTAFFLSEMEKGLEGKDSSLAMIPTYTSEASGAKAGEPVIVIDAGGTNLRTCLVTFDEEFKPVISDFRKVSMPGVANEVTAKEFFGTFADNVERLIDKSDRIGFCFSYAATITENHDGVPIVFSKEIKAPEVIGMPVAASLLRELAARGHDVSKKKFCVVNDTVATLLACKAQASLPSSGCVGFILGTGTNTAYSEDNANIGKLHASEGRQIINVESGSCKVDLGEADRGFLASTKNPTVYHFEKMISGAYLGSFSHYVINLACVEGLFSEHFVNEFSALKPLTTTQMSNYLEMPLNQDYVLVKCVGDNEDDATTLWLILRSIIERAAKLTAVNLSAAVLKGGAGKDPRYPVIINADGTTFYKTEFLKSYTEYYLHEFLELKKGRFVKLVRIDDSPTLGAAIAGLSV